MSGLIAVAFRVRPDPRLLDVLLGAHGRHALLAGDADGGDHERTHDEGGNQPLVHASRIFIMTCFADLLTALKNIPEGAGNVLDNTVILGSSDVADGQAHSLTDYPIVVAGGGGGFLKAPRRALPIHDAGEREHRAHVGASMLRHGAHVVRYGRRRRHERAARRSKVSTAKGTLDRAPRLASDHQGGERDDLSPFVRADLRAHFSSRPSGHDHGIAAQLSSVPGIPLGEVSARWARARGLKEP